MATTSSLGVGTGIDLQTMLTKIMAIERAPITAIDAKIKKSESSSSFLRKAKKNVYVPFMQGDSFKIVKYRLPLFKKRFGINEPNNSFFKARKIDLAVIPVVGIDAVGKRIGFGKGMYDRFFARLKYRPIMVFTQLVLCKSEKILSEGYDIHADYIITS